MFGLMMVLSAMLMIAPPADLCRMVVVDDDGVVSDLPLEHTSAEIQVDGSIQLVTVRQVYGNPYSDPIETVYVFPLPDNGAVYSMDMEIGDRRIEGEINERMEAQRIYQEAISQGRTASLLEQERPNVFTQTVGNILPGDDIVIEIKYAAPVGYNDGNWEVVYPMVVGPRFNPSSVGDADRISPEIVPEGTRSGYDVELSLTIDAGMEIREFDCLNHAISTEMRSNDVLFVELSRENEIPNRDFVFTYRTAGDDIGVSLISHNGDLGGHFMLMLEPDAEVDLDDIAPKEIFFVVDNSGSMSGQPMEVAKQTVRQFVRGMNENDSFQIMKFSETASAMSRQPLENTASNIRRGIEYIDEMYGMGGTMMIEGVRACIGYPEDPERMRYVIFLTDGYIGNETEILSELRTTLGDNIRLFSIGVGSSVNRYLIEGLAEEGRGYATYVSLDQDPKEAVEDVFNKINNPYLVDISIDWGNLDVTDVYPREIRDLYDGEPLVVVGRYDEPGRGQVTISGTLNGNDWEKNISVVLVREGGTIAADRLWARQKIHSLNRTILSTNYVSKPSDGLTERLIGVSLDYGVLCEHTAFVAVDSYERTDGGLLETIGIPVNMPEGVSYSGVFGSTPQPCVTESTVNRCVTGSSSVGYCGGGSGGMISQEMADCEEIEWEESGCEDMPYEMVYYYSVSLSSISDYCDARPSVFRSVIIELVNELNSEVQFESSGTIEFEIVIDSSSSITSISVIENSTEVADIEEIIEEVLLNKTIDGASAGRSVIVLQLI